MPKMHEIKLSEDFFDAVANGKKCFELRKNDRDYHIGDSLDLREWTEDPDGSGRYTGSIIRRDIVYMLEDYPGLAEGYVILGIEPVKDNYTEARKKFDVKCFEDSIEEMGYQKTSVGVMIIHRSTCENAIRALEATTWIPCSERLPKQDGWYLTTCHPLMYMRPLPEVKIQITRWCDGEWGDSLLNKTAAWMPLPEPYIPEEA